MHGGQDEPTSGVEPLSSADDDTPVSSEIPDPGLVLPPSTAPASEPSPPPPADQNPSLPRSQGVATPAMVPAPAEMTRGAETWYRNEQDRYRSVHRRANPWYRRLARGFIGLCFLAAAGVGLFFGARLVQDYLDRDRLPSFGEEVPTIRATSFEIRSNAPAPVLDGTMTLDATTSAFEFIGRGTGPQAGTQVVSTDGETVFIRRGSGAWGVATADDAIARDAKRAAGYLKDDDSADDILTSAVRRDFVDLVERTELGKGADELRRFELQIDTTAFEAVSPLDFQSYERHAIPGVALARALPVTITLDADNVLMQVDDTVTKWSWQRLTYSDQPFVPIEPVLAVPTLSDSSDG